MDRCLEHFLLTVGMAKQLGGEQTRLRRVLDRPAVGFELEQLFSRDVYLQPFPKVYRTGAVAPCCL